MYKFRTMVLRADLGSALVPAGDPRITRMGVFLRKTKLDELPQLINVFKGEMSLVGPRPEMQEYVDGYGAEEEIILAVPPGITDWASLWNSDEGALLAGFDDAEAAYREVVLPRKLLLQKAYVLNRSWGVDLRILFFTLLRVLGREAVPREVRSLLEA
jgi:lipopolysaccharide/colanic/teichoic acid biosynthesis glycosyltransferase